MVGEELSAQLYVYIHCLEQLTTTSTVEYLDKICEKFKLGLYIWEY